MLVKRVAGWQCLVAAAAKPQREDQIEVLVPSSRVAHEDQRGIGWQAVLCADAAGREQLW